jgi:hypothetical protein
MFSHLNNLKNKINSNYKSQGQFFEDFYKNHYEPWHQSNLAIKSISRIDISKKVRLLEKYYKAVDDINNCNRPRGKQKNWITFQSKFRPSVLEEFCYYLFKDIPEIKKLKLEFRKKKIHAGFEINSKGEIISREKDVDCCVVKAAQGVIEKKKIVLLIPIIAIECKTYLDGTMWNEVQYSAIILKRVNSSAKVYVLTEDNQVKLSKITKESPIDDVFVIRAKDSSKIDTSVIIGFFSQIRKDLQRLINPSVIKIPGRLINF